MLTILILHLRVFILLPSAHTVFFCNWYLNLYSKSYLGLYDQVNYKELTRWRYLFINDNSVIITFCLNISMFRQWISYELFTNCFLYFRVRFNGFIFRILIKSFIVSELSITNVILDKFCAVIIVMGLIGSSICLVFPRLFIWFSSLFCFAELYKLYFTRPI